ncbi:MAG: hypothetical protein HOF23_12330, partial [Rhodospirillaceae bacterium]|nr:hypothetical protein [Rhodospirillaceae bacterium]
MVSQVIKDMSAKILEVLNGAPKSFLAAYPEGAVLVDPDGAVLESNKKGSPLAALIDDDQPAELHHLIRQVQNGQGANLSGVLVGDDIQLNITAVPVQDGDAILLLTHDQTFEHNMLSALVDSRARYKDFVDVSSDFAWEVGPDDTFVFVSPDGALDYTSDDIIGQSPDRFGFELVNSNDQFPFFTTEPTADIDVRMRLANGEQARL